VILKKATRGEAVSLFLTLVKCPALAAQLGRWADNKDRKQMRKMIKGYSEDSF
jgi:hypothetical protein